MSVPRLLALAVAAALAGPPAAAAHVLHVGPGQRFARPCQAIAAARAGDTIEIDARGNRGYRGDVCAWSTDHLTIVGVHGRAHIDAAGANSEGKAIWVIAGNDTTIENVELSGARVPDDNGAGIRQEGAGLLVEHCRFDHNQEGILAADNPASDIVIDSSVFTDNGAGDGFSHNIYINHVRSFTLRDSYSTDARVGHLVKSRALRNYILYDRLTGERGTDSYELDLPNGGLSYVIGTVLQQGRGTENPNMLAYGEEGALNPDSHLYVVNDTFVNDLRRGAAIFVGPEVSPPVTAENDINAGSPQFVTQAGARSRHNCTATHPGFVNAAGYDYVLRASSPCRRTGRRPGRAQGFSLIPRFQYAGVTGLARRTDDGTIAGAFGQTAG
ncbi:MAG TPA: right-handed parallel beta-helix repeat-containing protein [Solirubrobacteraceae bacterium]|nr:right-handed parallel beta-helix repeat-containing protein [Solirubrobacteraceae bacterium]